MKHTVKTGYAPVNGLQMYYEIHGRGGMPLVLIHGGGSTIESSWTNMLPLLSAHGEVIAMELQAHGRTNDRNAPESFEQDADDIAALMKYLGISKANFFGFSNGGTTTLQLAIRHPGLVNKLIDLAGSYQREGVIPGFFEGFKGATIDNVPKKLQEAFLKVNPDKSRLQVMFEKGVARMVSFKDISEDVMKSISASALIIVGDQDVVPIEHAVKLAHVIKGARMIVLPGPHGVCIGAVEAGSAYAGQADNGQPKITAALIEEFLNA
ncbi:MAG: alpha/beta hydrolase [Bacteroidetes bacterium]|nr:alpha/beta hydrolase [Bacteroidota bacterium]